MTEGFDKAGHKIKKQQLHYTQEANHFERDPTRPALPSFVKIPNIKRSGLVGNAQRALKISGLLEVVHLSVDLFRALCHDAALVKPVPMQPRFFS